MQPLALLNAFGAALRRAGARLRDFPRDSRGSAAVYVAAVAVPLIAIVGVSIDAARGYLIKSKLSQALDAAGLAGGRVALSPSRDDDIRMFFNTNFPPGYMQAVITGPHIAMDEHAQQLTLSATAQIPTTFMRILGHQTMDVSASNVIHRHVKGMELALVMDNTGSMDSNDRMELMKQSASDLVNILFGNRETAPNFWVALIPYVAVVNIGTQHADWTFAPTHLPVQISAMSSKKVVLSSPVAGAPTSWRVKVTTTAAHGFHHGQLIDIAGVTGSNNIYNGRVMIRTSESGAPGIAPYTGSDAITDATRQFVYYVDRDMSSFFPITGFDPTVGGAGQAGPPITSIASATATKPQPTYPAATPAITWKGCVEARDNTDYEAGSAEALPSAQQWRRSYWPSTLGVRYYKVNGVLLEDGGPARAGDNQWGLSRNPDTDERPAGPLSSAPGAPHGPGNDAYGPNLGCGPAITSLQPFKSKALAAIDQMMPWSRGGTMANLGLAWGWRVLSPDWRGMWGGDTPASYPLDYNSALVDKVVVLLTDGNNEWYDHPCRPPGNADGSCNTAPPGGMDGDPLPRDADYTAYGRLAEGRVGTTDNATARATINARMTGLCTAMKAKGIIIYTIVVEVTSTDTQALYRGCATKPEFAFIAPTPSQLTVIFREIASQLTNLRLAR